MRLNLFNVITIIFSFLFLLSCGNKKTTVPRSSGKTAELIVVTNNETKWEGVIGDSIRAFFEQEYEVMSQSEPLFEMGNIQIPKFNNTKMFKSHHNVFIVDIDNATEEVQFDVKKDLWASPQMVVKITAPSNESFIGFFEEKKEVLYSIFMKSERERLIRTFKAFRDQDIQNQLRKNFNLTMEIPSGFYIAKKYADFAWIRKETQHNSQGIMIYTYDFTDTVAFNPERIKSFRNSITKEHIPGPADGSYMIIADDLIPTKSKRIDFNGSFAVETRGLWELEGDFMGGSFINYTFVDEKRNKVVTIDGYIFAPNAPKRDLLIQIEAIAYSLKLMN